MTAKMDYQRVMDSFADAVVASDGADRIVYANLAAERLLGWTRGELLGKPLTHIMPERLRAAHEAGFRRYMATRQGRILGKPVRVPALHREGHEVEVELTLSAYPLEEGDLVVAALRDLRERVELERQLAAQRHLRAQNAVLSALMQAQGLEDAMVAVLQGIGEALEWDAGIFWKVDPVLQRLQVSSTWTSATGAAQAFLEASRQRAFAPGDGLPGRVWQSQRFQWSRDVVQDGRYPRRREAAAEGLHGALLFPIFSSSQVYGVLEFLCRSPREPDEALVQTMESVGFQLGQFLERNRTVEALRDSEARLRLLAEASAVLGTSLDSHETLRALARLVVPRVADWCSVSLQEQEEAAPTQVVVAHVDAAKEAWALELQQRFPPDPAAPRGAISVIRTGRPEMYPDIPDALLQASARSPEHLRLLREVGMRSALIVPMKARGRTFGAITLVAAESGRRYAADDLAMAQELADRASVAVDNARLYREAQQAIHIRDEFLSVASHELRTPLTPLQLQLQSIQRRHQAGETLPALLVSKLDSMGRQVARLEKLVRSLLDISRISQDRLELECEELDLAQLAHEVAGRLEAEAARTGTEVRVHTEGPVVGCWDRLRLEQVLGNLLGNALKFGPGQPIEVRVEGTQALARLRVQDRGLGISPEDQARIFERFERAVPIRHYGGFGLGLWISRQMVEAMGGAIRVESTLGHGSIFTVELPLKPPPRQESAPQPH
jgi:PAS domain S-box-containing protein